MIFEYDILRKKSLKGVVMNNIFSQYSSIIFIVIWAAVFYFLLILPNKRRQKKHKEMVESLKDGVEVLTTGGIKGTVTGINSDFITLRVDKGVHIQVVKGAISRVLK